MTVKKFKFQRFKEFNPGKPMVVFFLLFFPLLLFLGCWQVDRATYKTSLWNNMDEKKKLVPVEEVSFQEFSKEELFYRSLSIEGNYLEKSFLLDNRMYRNKKGYEVFTPFQTNANRTFIVNRGWILEDKLADIYIRDPNTKLKLEGLLTPFNRFGLNLSDRNQKKEFNWPRVVQEITYTQTSKDLKIENLYEGVIQLSAGSKSSLEPIWKPFEFKASRHFGYAVQWFGLSLVLLISFIYFGFKGEKNGHE